MIVRAVFSVLVTLGLLVGAVVWHAPEPGGTPEPAEVRSAHAEPLVDGAVRAAAQVAAQLEEVARDAAPAAREAVTAARQLAADARAMTDAAAALLPVAPDSAGEAPVVETVAHAAEASVSSAKSERGPAAGVGDPPTVAEVLLSGGPEPFREGPADTGEVVAVGPSEVVAAHVPVRRDPDAWAALVWRMLDIYERVEGD